MLCHFSRLILFLRLDVIAHCGARYVSKELLEYHWLASLYIRFIFHSLREKSILAL